MNEWMRSKNKINWKKIVDFPHNQIVGICFTRLNMMLSAKCYKCQMPFPYDDDNGGWIKMSVCLFVWAILLNGNKTKLMQSINDCLQWLNPIKENDVSGWLVCLD